MNTAHADFVGVFLEKASRAHLTGMAAGFAQRMPSQATRERRHAQIMTPHHMDHFWALFCRKLAWLEAQPGCSPAAVFSL